MILNLLTVTVFANPKNYHKTNLGYGYEKISLTYPSGDSASINSDASVHLGYEFQRRLTYNNYAVLKFNYNYIKLLTPQSSTLSKSELHHGTAHIGLKYGKRLGFNLGVKVDLENYMDIADSVITPTPMTLSYGYLGFFLKAKSRRLTVKLESNLGSLVTKPSPLNIEATQGLYWNLNAELIYRYKFWSLSGYGEFQQRNMQHPTADQNRATMEIGFKIIIFSYK